ncbi:MAG: DEAD/DEAH box helicase [Candidatus Dojkabacteria bacterium]
MVQEFLEKIFKGLSKTSDLGSFHLINFKNIDFSRLFCVYLSNKTSSNVLFVPDSYLHPELSIIHVVKDSPFSVEKFTKQLIEIGYTKTDQVFDELQFSQKGDVITVYTDSNDTVYRVDFFGDRVESISLLDNVSLRVKHELTNALLLNIHPDNKAFNPEFYGEFTSVYEKLVIHSVNSELTKGLLPDSSRVAFDTEELPLFRKNVDVYQQYMQKYNGYSLYYSGNNYENLPEGFYSVNAQKLANLSLSVTIEKGFVIPEHKVVVLTDRELVSTLNLTKSRTKTPSKYRRFFDNEVNIGDYIVHEAHGVGIYNGIERKVVLGEPNEYVVIEYQDKETLLIPLTQLDRVSKFVAHEGHEPKVTKLGTAEWSTIQRRLKKSVEDIAKELLEIYAKKNIQKGFKFDEDSHAQLTFEKAFPYKLTEDQIRALHEIKDDMESLKPMDRLLIGDVGFGKTEVALRAAFKAVQNRKQVMVLAPTTVLVSQLYNVFASRLQKFHVHVARVSRFDGTSKNKQNIEAFNQGKINILIGTHRLLSNDVQPHDLGLLIIDEEQRFGVKQKEKIRSLRTNIDLLSMSATPIPRTLQMSLTGIRDISIIATPPHGRQPVHTEVIFDDEIPDKIRYEYKRKGQTFVVYNQIETMPEFVQRVHEELPPQAKIVYGHGRMAGEKLEDIMMKFQEREFDVLFATTIIENGIDIPAVNTIIIDSAHEFGLSQLYQLRGRVGRADTQAYCYLVVPKSSEFISLHKRPDEATRNLGKLLEEHKIEDRWITPEAISRIRAILDNQELGAGFKIASRDLEIRGSGNILGSQQSGHINAVGYELYIRLLEQEIRKIKSLPVPQAEEMK